MQNVRCAVQNVHCGVVLGQIWLRHSNRLKNRSLCWKFQKNRLKKKENVREYPHRFFYPLPLLKVWLESRAIAHFFQLGKVAMQPLQQYMTNSTIVYLVKMEYGWNFSFLGHKIMEKSSQEKMFLKFLHAQAIFY